MSLLIYLSIVDKQRINNGCSLIKVFNKNEGDVNDLKYSYIKDDKTCM